MKEHREASQFCDCVFNSEGWHSNRSDKRYQFMAELNLKQIADKLNAEFTVDVRKLVFWYDDNAEFAEEIDTL